MTITCQPMDATAGSPAFSAQNERQALAALFGGGGGVALAARAGFRVGTPSNILTATSTTWTLGPCSAVISPNFATAQGSYRWSTDANITGTVRASNVTYDRKDIVYIQVNDSSSGDGSGALTAPPAYAYGPEDGTVAAPVLPARSFLVGTITVPKTGTGSPTVILNPAVFVAAGAKLPISLPSERAALAPYLGFEIQRLDLQQVSPAGVKEVWNGSTWDHFGHSEWTFNQTNPGFTSGIQFGSGALANDAAKTTDTGFVTTTGETLVVRDAGIYSVTLNGTWSHPSTGRCFSQITESTGGSVIRAGGAVNEDNVGVSASNLKLGAGGVITPATYAIIASGSNTWVGRIRVTRVG